MERKRRSVFVAVMLLVGLAGTYGEDAQHELDLVTVQWTDALNSGDIDGFMGCYWNDAVRIMYFPFAESMDEGADAIREAQAGIFAQRGSEPSNLVYEPPIRFFPDAGRPTYILRNTGLGYMELFEFERRRNTYRIVTHYVLPYS